MTLIFIIIALAVDLISVDLDRFRRFEWFISLHYLLGQHLGNNKYWGGNIALLVLLSVPLLTLTFVLFLLSYWSSFAESIFIVFVLIYCVSPRKLLNQFDNYIVSLERDETDHSLLAQELMHENLKRLWDE